MKTVHYMIMAYICMAITLSIANPLYADIDSGMVGYWKFDEGVDLDVFDSTANSNDGTLKGAGTVPTLPEWINNGAIGKALEFNGSDTYVEIPYDSSLNLINNFTVSLWLKAYDTQGWLFSKGVYCSGPRSWALTLRDTRFNIVYSQDGDSINGAGSQKNIFYTNNQYAWNHGVFVYEDGTAKLYMNGDLVDSIYLRQDMFSNTNPIRIGHFQCNEANSWGAFSGAIDEVRLYDRALDNDDVLELYIAEKYNTGTPLIDNNPPSVPANIVIETYIGIENKYSTRVDISWSESTEPENETEVKKYYIYRDGIHIATHLGTPGTGTEYYSDLINVEPATTYSYTVSAVDTAGNESAQSATVNIDTPAVTNIPVFPGAEGYGTTTVAGSGRNLAPIQSTVYKVTTLEDTYSWQQPISGSLRECVQAAGPRICVFETSGTIELKNTMSIAEPYITIAGQTAPSPGITLTRGVLGIYTHDVLVRHMRVRSGDNPPGTPEHRDALAIAGNEAGSIPVYNVVVDHCSFSWAMDETVQFWYPGIHDGTVSNSISSEALHDSLHQKGPHSMGFLVGPGSNEISINRNLLAHNNDRNPLISQDTRTHVINNLIYNPGGNNTIRFSNAINTEPSLSSIIGNAVIPGDDTHIDLTFSARLTSSVNNGSMMFALDNICSGELQNDPWSCVLNNKGASVKSPLPPVPASPYYEEWPSPLTILPGNEIEDYIINNVGARPADRGPVDARIIDELINRTGYIIDCVEEGTIYHPDGTALNATVNTITLDDDASNYNDRYNGQIIEITGGTGNGQSRQVTDYEIVLSGVDITARIATASQDWNPQLDTTSEYRIVNVCGNSAPEGWTPLAVNARALTLPADEFNDDDGDGYTNLEEWLQLYADSVEGNLICTDVDDNGTAGEGGPCGNVHNCPAHLTARVSDTYYSSLSLAYGAASGGDIIRSRDEAISGDLVFDMDKNVTLDGGYSCDYSGITGATTLNGNIFVNNGTVTIGDFLIN